MATLVTLDGRFENSLVGRTLIDSHRRWWWKNNRYEKRLLYTLTLTNKCTLRCEHCFEEAGSEKNDFLDTSRLEELAEESVEVFQKYPRSGIRVTGGDPFLHPDLFKIIEFFSEKKDELGYTTLNVETNGWWAVDDKTALKNVAALKEAGATLLSMTLDYYHSKQKKFDNHNHFNRINAVCKELNFEFQPINLGFPVGYDEDLGTVPEVVPIGRARQIPEERWGYHLGCRAEGCRLFPPTQVHKIYADGPYYVLADEITLGPTGNVYPCNSGKEFEHVTLALGNINNGTLQEIIKTENPLVNLIRSKGLRPLTKIAGFSLREHWAMYDKFSPCGLCHEMLRGYGDKIAGALNNGYK